MQITTLLFLLLSIMAVGAALMVLFCKNPVHSILWLIVVFFAISGHYLLLNAQFLAVVNIIVYAGAIMVLFLYVIMMFNLNKEAEPHKDAYIKLAATIAGGIFMIVLIGSLKGVEHIENLNTPNQSAGLIKNLGNVLYRDYMLPFEMASILFLSAMVGAVFLGKNELK